MCYSVVGLSLCQFLCVRYLCSHKSSISSTIQNLLVRILAHFLQFQQLKSLGGFTSPLVMFFFKFYIFVYCRMWKVEACWQCICRKWRILRSIITDRVHEFVFIEINLRCRWHLVRCVFLTHECKWFTIQPCYQRGISVCAWSLMCSINNICVIDGNDIFNSFWYRFLCYFVTVF